MPNNKQIGDFGENMACEYLENKGYEILYTNYKTPMGEVDIIAMSEEKCVVFVEVKTRKNTNFGLACEAVDKRKQERITRAALFYNYNGDKRFDVIEVYYSGTHEMVVENINHIENAF